MKSVGKTTSSKIANASVFAMMMIVGIHVLGHGWQSLEKGSALWWFTAFGQYGVFSVAVPFFFTCSGYFLAGHMDEDGWWHHECRKRLGSLLVPYVFWCVFFTILSFVLEAFVASKWSSSWTSLPFWLDAFGLSPFRHPSLGPLWYVRALLMFVGISPVVFIAVRRWGIFFLAIVYVLAGVVHPIGRIWKEGSLFFTYCFNLSGFMFFSIGVYGRMKSIKLPSRGHFLSLIIGLGLVFMGAYCNLCGMKCRIPQSGLVLPFLLFGLWGFTPERKLPNWLTGTTFAILLIHIPLYKTLGFILPMNVETVLQWIAKWCIGWGGSLVLAIAIGRCCPNTAKMLFGGRV